MDDIDALDAEIDALEAALGGASAMTAAFTSEVSRLQGTVAATGRDVDVLSKGLSRGLRRAFDGLIFDGASLSDALNKVARSMVDAAYSAAIRPVTNHFGGLIASGVEGLFSGAFADGASFSQGRVQPFASGGIVSGPVAFPMRGGVGLMGEAGPEAIMPLTRGSDGKLGVRSQSGGRAIAVTINVSTPDAPSFQRSQGQIASQLSRAIGRAERNR